MLDLFLLLLPRTLRDLPAPLRLLLLNQPWRRWRTAGNFGLCGGGVGRRHVAFFSFLLPLFVVAHPWFLAGRRAS
jgi:hypothetical protein